MKNMTMRVESSIIALWDKYRLPQNKRNHCILVAQVAHVLARELVKRGINVDIELLTQAALLHDIDKAVLSKNKETHPECAVRILKEEGLPEIAQIVRTHAVHTMLEKENAPSLWEEKLLYIADKMAKHRVMTLEERFALWFSEDLPDSSKQMLETVYPLARQLVDEVADILGMSSDKLAKMIKKSVL